MSNTFSFRGKIDAYSNDRSRAIVRNLNGGRSAWVNVKDIKKMVPSGLAHVIYMDRGVAVAEGLIDGEA